MDKTLFFSKKMLPGYGYFGSGEFFRLNIPIHSEVKSIKFLVDDDFPGILNLAEINFHDSEGNRIDKNDVVDDVIFSSTPRGVDESGGREKILNGRLISTGKEVRPFLIINFKANTEIGAIQVNNRPDIHGLRSKHLKIVKNYGLKSEACIYANYSESSYISELRAFLEEIGCQESIPNSENDYHTFISEVCNQFKMKLTEGGFTWPPKRVMQLLPIHEKNPILNELHFLALSSIFFYFLGQRYYFKTMQLKPLANLLSSDIRIEEVSRLSSEILSSKFSDNFEIMVSKHHVHNSRLSKKKDSFINALNEISNVLESLGTTPMLCYGTLLGAVREGQFLKNDDDVDVLVFYPDVSSEKELTEKNQWLLERIKNKGYVVNGSSSNPNFHVRVNGTAIDIFPAWGDKNNINVVMEKLKYRTIEKDIVLPVGKVLLHNHAFAAPNKPEKFLEERYGRKWYISDPYYEWPWSVAKLYNRCNDSMGTMHTKKRSMNRTSFVAWGQRVDQTKKTPPKNSLAIIRQAENCNFDVVELDIRMSKDNVPFLSHDDIVEGEKGRIRLSKNNSTDLHNIELGDFCGETYYLTPLSTALTEIHSLDVLLDTRVLPEEFEHIRNVIDDSCFPDSRVQFCVYNASQVEYLNYYFPESIVLWKLPKPYYEIHPCILDEVQRSGADGVMIYYPLHDEDFSTFIFELRKRDLKVLFYIHGSINRRFADDKKDESLFRMVVSGADYITTVSPHIETFRELVEHV